MTDKKHNHSGEHYLEVDGIVIDQKERIGVLGRTNFLCRRHMVTRL